MKVVTLGALVLLGSGYTISQTLSSRAQEIDERLEAAAEGIVTLRVESGIVRITGWAANEVGITGTIARGDDLSATSEHGHARISLDSRDTTNTLLIQVPRNSNLDIESNDANVYVSGVSGLVRHSSGGGDLTIEGHPRGLMAQSQSGDIQVLSAGVRGIVHSEEGTVSVRADLDRHHSPSQIARRADFDFGDLGLQVSNAVEAALSGLDLSGMVDYSLTSDYANMALSASFDVDFLEFEDLFDELEVALMEIGDDLDFAMAELSEGMRTLGEDLEAWGKDFDVRNRRRENRRRTR